MSKKVLDMQKIINGEVPPPPIARLIGAELVYVEEGKAVFELQCNTEKHANPMGTIHGGILCDIADMAMGVAFSSTLETNETFTTVELKINYLKPVWNEKIIAKGEVMKRGNTIGLIKCDVFDEGGSLVAHALSTCMILRGEKSAGR
ncbi:PaaI family thioesterase [Bacillus sp. sid0103]|uniref:PaaI family thioesterase n=1 Tax=Bacillus sp. sid0103 TaxID=2856337 RepID=UPI001C44D213|nr:PaaI family thioesterase [Bacillus sp. sid0103]MBV7509095.1 PaaI family thioesterase [Bacillus sp. sid0103]